MTLRSRLVLALVILATVGLAIFGVTTYSLYRRGQEQQLDRELEAIAGGQAGRLAFAARSGQVDTDTCEAGTPGGQGQRPGQGQGQGQGNGGGEQPNTTVTTPGPGGPPGQSVDAYAELRDADGDVISCVAPLTSTATPDLPEDLGGGERRFLTTGSSSGSGNWRVLVQRAEIRGPLDGPTGGDPTFTTELQQATIVVAVPTAGMDASMERLLRIEVIAALVLLSALGVGAWVIMRAGLRPLEEMADSAATITAGDLSQRVEPADDRTEVGQLGLALNTMLDGIEVSFQEREATERRLRQFLSDASHELRTPLTSIQGFAELFRLNDQERIDLPVIMRRIEQESGRMKTLVEDLLLLARLDETRPAEAAPVDLSVLAADACTDAVALSPERQVTLDAPYPVVVRGDTDHLRQAIANLVANAIKHTPDGTPVEVSTRISGDRATVTVRDHGGGLSAEAMAHVFDRFWQADEARVGTGSGLGLSIVAGIAEEHGGEARAENAPDGGARFTIDIPVSGPSGGATVD